MKKILIFIGLVVIIAGLGLYFGLYNKDKLTQIVNPGPEESPAGEEIISVEPDPIFAEPVVYGSLKQQYSGNSFAFKYPDGFKASLTQVEGGDMVTVENPKGSGFQIFILAWDEAGPITPERIWQDMPDADVIDPKNAVLDDIKTLVFNGYDEDFGETFEAWVVYKGKLYQIAGPKTAQQLIVETLETWDWK